MRKSVDLTEYIKLKYLLTFFEVPFEEKVTEEAKDVKEYYDKVDPKGYKMDRFQLFYPNARERKSDVVINGYSYGHEDGLLEQMGLIKSEFDDHDVEGHLDAMTVFKRWAEDYGYFVKGLDT